MALILLAEANASRADDIRRTLQENGHVVGVVCTAANAVAAASRKRPHLVIINTRLNHECGIRALGQIRADMAIYSTPVMMLIHHETEGAICRRNRSSEEISASAPVERIAGYADVLLLGQKSLLAA